MAIDPANKARHLAEAEVARAELKLRLAGQKLVLLLAAMLVLLVAVVMGIFAAYLFLAELYGPPLAALICSGAALVIAVLILLVANGRPSRADRLEQQLADQAVAAARADLQRDVTEIENTLKVISRGFAGLLGGGKVMSVAALLLGALASFSPGLRKFVQAILKAE